ncbi:glutamine--fructose-6-phosphate transaminase (isomerizing) [Emcibacter nanhaiensis]|uniref:Glutamine--fructose-6-phosphate aminotransferase [isomerizing] n=1 Tax=Emcibacter nanhaiensis TaxID=1505037 RepID=A0A501PAA9_9PROT|nr:glutamine--fructose-6-phosphate transaminase (isomerizing) [Emcibacter nanhaiensis]TPD57309.1 glutamine--fructose-6-phosphate transaminase (isomerizing) [Emcibacter nanhaiensis]
MCGIIGIIGKEEVTPRILDGLRRLEYRGYDSAGIATLFDGKSIDRRRAEGKLKNLEARLADAPLPGVIGIGHTRWATHGAPTEVNAHPHATPRVAAVHNGIIENFRELREELTAEGHVFETETDTETIVHLITSMLDKGMAPRDAAKAAIERLEGAFGLAIIFDGEDDLMIGARRGSPLVVGYGDGEMYLGSDAIALSDLSNRIVYLEEGDRVELTRESARIYDETGKEVIRPVTIASVSGGMIDKGNYRHFMLKEIYEQPTVVGQTIATMVDPLHGTTTLPEFPFDLAAIERVTIIACGTSFYAGMVAKYWLEQMARINVEVDIASEFRYREAVMPPGGLAIFISQSGETADTLAALRYAKSQGQHILTIVNVPQSSMERESDIVLQTHAGPEVGVASTKAFTCQLSVLACLSIAVAKARGKIDHAEEERLVNALTEVPARMAEVLNHDEAIEALADDMSKARDVIYLGRGPEYPIAMEGALKLKEISYIHAEGYAAGEMKHGPIALIDELVPIIVIAPTGRLFEKTVSNMQEVIARKGRVIFITDEEGSQANGHDAEATIALPMLDEFVTPLLYAIPVQLLSYHVAVAKGTDVDQPRNLAKSVTVE